MVLFADLWSRFQELLPYDVQQTFRNNTGPFVLVTLALAGAFLALPLLAWSKKGPSISGKYRAAPRGWRASLLAVGLGLALLAPFASTYLLRLVGR
jgi:hypothetical protein